MKFLETFKVFFKNSEIKYRILDNGNTCSALRFEALEARELLSADAGLAIQETVSSVNSTEFVTTQETDDLIVDLSALTDKESFEGTSNSFFEEMIDDLMEPLDNENDDMSLQNAFEENSTVFDDVEIFSLNFETGQDRQSILDDSLYLSDEALSTTVLTYSLGGNSSGGSSSGGNSSGGNSSGGNSSGGNSSGGNSSGGNSSGGNSSGGNSSGGTDGHSYCFNKPIIEVDKLEQALASSGGSVSGGTAFPRMMLTSPNNLRVTITATDNDMVNGVDEQLRLVCTGLPCTLVETRRISGGYNFFVDIDISQSGRLNGSFTVVDKHNEASVPWVVDYTLVTINGFEWKERAPGESGYHDLVDPHVIWQRENENRIFFSTTPQIDYNNPAQVSAFLNLFNSQELYREWVWTGENYVQSNTWGERGGRLGVYDMKINVQNKINNEILTFQDPLYYCFNSISSVEWVTAQGYSPTNEHLEIVADADSSCVKAFVEQPLITTNESVTLGMEKNVATVEVTLDCIIPTGLQGTVSIQCFDPDNAIARTVTTDGGGRRDNHGTIETTQPVRLFFNQQQGTLSRSYAYTISGGYAGDNYIVAAHPNFSVLGRAVIRQADSAAHTATAIAVPNSSASGGVSGSGGVASGGNVYGACKFLMTTKTLTVWRTLWIERDQMILTLPTGLEIIADEAPIDGLVEEQLGRACIQVREFLPNINVTVAGPEFVDLDNTQLDASSLDSLGFSNSFWSILLLSAFRSSDPEDVGACGGDHILLFNWTVNHACNVASMQQESDVTEVKRQVILHEIAHSFGLEHAPDEQRPDLMNPRLGVWEKLQEEYRTFTDVQLLSIQSFRVSADL